MKDLKVYPIRTKILIMQDTEAIITGINILPEGIIYNLEYFCEGQLLAIRMYDFQLEEYGMDAKLKSQKIGFYDGKENKKKNTKETN